jgi:hypothetical protein
VSNHLGRYFRARRLELGLSLGEVARRLGYSNITKGARRIQQLEDVGECTRDLLDRLLGVLGVDRSVAKELLGRDRAEYFRAWEEWVSEPVPIRMVIRWIPGVLGTRPLPTAVTTPEQAVAYAQDFARTHRTKVFVELSRRTTVTIDEHGEVTGRLEATPQSDPRPFMQVGNTRFLFGTEGPGKAVGGNTA